MWAGAQSAPSATTASGRSSDGRLRGASNGEGVIAWTMRASHCWYGLSTETSARPEAAAINGRENRSSRQSTAWSKRRTCEPSFTARKATSRFEDADWMRRSNSRSASAGFGASLMGPCLLLGRLLEHRGAHHSGKEAVRALVDARFELELLAHAIDPRVQLGNLCLEHLPGLRDIDGERRAGVQPAYPRGRHEHLRLERRRIDYVDERLAEVHTLCGLDAHAGHSSGKRRVDPAVRQLGSAHIHLAAGLVRRRGRDSHLQLAGCTERLQ